MSILESIGAASALLKGATGLVREFKRSSPGPDAFAAVLRDQMAESRAPERTKSKLIAASENFVRLRDANGDGFLSRDESGLDKAQFARLDLDGDGKLSAEELRRPYVDALAANTKE